MFDLKFFRIVGNVLRWTESPPVRFVSPHEYKIETSKDSSISDNCLKVSKLMAPEIIQLHMYVKRTYAPYFGIEFRSTDSKSKYNYSAFQST